MQAILNSLNEVLGVRGAFICGSGGEILARTESDHHPSEQIEAVGRTLVQTLDGLTSIKRRKVVAFDMLYERGRILVRKVKDGSLWILCEPDVNLPLLNLTTSKALKTLKKTYAGTEELTPEDPLAEIRSKLKAIAEEVLGDYAGKAIALLEEAGDSEADLLAACEEAEKMTRMFINKEKAIILSARMKATLDR